MDTLRRMAVVALVLCTTIAAAPEPAAAPSGGDLVDGFAGSWACRTVEGVVVHQNGSRQGDTIVVHDDVERNGKHSEYEDRYVFERALNRWHVETGLGGFSGSAPPWTAGSWIVESRNADDVPVRMTLEALPGGDFRRTFAYDRKTDWFAYSVERCTPGGTPPPANACIAARYPATTLETAYIDWSGVPIGTPSGTVTVLVSLDAASRITGTRVIHSTSPPLNMVALAAVRASKFRTAIVNCKPIAADYVFTVTTGP